MIKCCTNCVAPRRHIGCHSTCEEYKKSKDLLDAHKDTIAKAKAKEDILNEYLSNRSRKSGR